MDVIDKLKHNIGTIGKHLFIDDSEEKFGDATYPYWNMTLMSLGYFMNKNVMLLGEPGFGKTTAAKVMGSVYSGYPFDLFESAQFQGCPEQTVESLVGRLDFSKLTQEEKVIWQMGIYLPMIILDEMNRLPGGKQDIELNSVDTGRFSYLNDTFFSGKKPFFATANHPDDGNHVIIPPLADRFAISIELGYQGPFAKEQIRRAKGNIKSDLTNNEITNKIIACLKDTQTDVGTKLKQIDSLRKPYVKDLVTKTGIELITEEEAEHFREKIKSIEFSSEAYIFLQCIDTELNYGGTYGKKRSCDAIDSNGHMENIASSHVKNAFSPRALEASLEDFSRAIAVYTGSKEVEKEHIRAMAPYVMEHRLVFTDDYTAAHEEKNRLEMNEIFFKAPTTPGFLARKLVEGIDENYKKVKDQVNLVYSALREDKDLTAKQKQEAKDLLKTDIQKIDHPLLKCLIYECKRRGM
ncbi:MAG: AAA family ATPase [Candidatus Woesearchaeota archaeon]